MALIPRITDSNNYSSEVDVTINDVTASTLAPAPPSTKAFSMRRLDLPLHERLSMLAYRLKWSKEDVANESIKLGTQVLMEQYGVHE